jgi:lipoprotein-releasing system permease protein
MNTGRDDIASLNSIEEIESIFPFIEKGALVKTDSNIHGIVMKGVDEDFDWTFFKNNLVKGRLPEFGEELSSDILISQMMANLLHLDIDSPVRVYYIMQGETQPRGRKYNVCGIYSTGMVEFDNIYALSDMRHLQQINHWGDSLVSGYEIMLKDFSMLDEVFPEVLSTIYYDLDASDIETRQIQFFDWLNLLDTNVLIILVLMTLVAIINVISIILMLILERIPMIGVLKSLGASNPFVIKIFVWHSLRLLVKGIIYGNIAGIGLILLQQYLHLLPLDQEMYYVSYVPVLLKPTYIITVNLGVFAIASLSMFLPSLIVRRIHPAKALRHQ